MFVLIISFKKEIQTIFHFSVKL